MGKKALVILAEGFEEIEAVTSIDVLRRAGVSVTVSGLDTKSVRGSHGITLETDNLLGEAGKEFDAVVLPGGMPGAKNLAASDKVNSLIKTINAQDKIIAAICAAPAVVLAQAGILDGKKATCFPGMEDQFSKNTEFREEAVVVDGNLITSRGPGTALLFALTIAGKLSGAGTAKKVKTATLL